MRELMNEKNRQKRIDKICCRTNQIKRKLSKKCEYLTNVNKWKKTNVLKYDKYCYASR